MNADCESDICDLTQTPPICVWEIAYTLKIVDPYECWDNLYGKVTISDNLTIDFVEVTLDWDSLDYVYLLSGSDIKNDEYTIEIEYDDPTSKDFVNRGSYLISYIVYTTDWKSASGSYSTEITKECGWWRGWWSRFVKDVAFCSNGVVEEKNGEQCDDGNQLDGDGCDRYCQIQEVKEVTIEPKEEEVVEIIMDILPKPEIVVKEKEHNTAQPLSLPRAVLEPLPSILPQTWAYISS